MGFALEIRGLPDAYKSTITMSNYDEDYDPDNDPDAVYDPEEDLEMMFDEEDLKEMHEW